MVSQLRSSSDIQFEAEQHKALIGAVSVCFQLPHQHKAGTCILKTTLLLREEQFLEFLYTVCISDTVFLGGFL